VPNRPLNTRLGRREPDLQLIQQTPAALADYAHMLDERLADEQRPEERLRMLRETTNRITRSANDAIQAYRRARASVDAELDMPDGDHAHARRMAADLDVARAEVLAALETANKRYPSGGDSALTEIVER
jgi:hypothetical protein